jgi:hypothetical protein
MPRTNFTLEVSHNDSICAGNIMDMLADAFNVASVNSYHSSLENVASTPVVPVVAPVEVAVVEETVVEETPVEAPTVTPSNATHFYSVDVAINSTGEAYSTPVACFFGELETVSAMRTFMDENNLLPDTASVFSVDAISNDECDEMLNNLSMSDPRYVATIETGDTWNYYAFFGSDVIMSTKRIYSDMDAVSEYAKQLGKFPMDASPVATPVNKGSYFALKYGAVENTSDWNYYSIELANTTYTLKTKFRFEDDVKLFAHFVRKNKVPSTALYYGQEFQTHDRESFDTLRD